MVDVRIKCSLDAIRLFVILFYTYIAYTCMHSPVSIPRLRLYRSIATKHVFFAFSAEREPRVDQLITDFPHHPNMSIPYIQDLAESEDSTVSGSSVPSDPG